MIFIAHTTMLCVLLLAAVLVGAGKRKLLIMKCCDTFQMLSYEGSSCVNAPWPRNRSLEERSNMTRQGYNIRLNASDAPWINQWLAPGIPLERVEKVEVDSLKHKSGNILMRVVKSSAEWDERQAETEGHAYWDNRVILTDDGHNVYRRESDNFNTISTSRFEVVDYMRARYCVDATQNPLVPYALILKRNCDIDECVKKCCAPGNVMAHKGDEWRCKLDAHYHWKPTNSSFASFLTSDLAFDSRFVSFSHHPSLPEIMKCAGGTTRAVRPAPGDARMAYLFRRRYHDFLFSTWDTCVDYERRKNGTVGETVFYCQYPRTTRGVYWLLRPLSFLSVALLLLALLSIACNSRTRRKVHGWCLACHGTCLLAFNVGQVVYYLAISDEIDAYNYVPPHLINICNKLALPMYFLLTAAYSWLTALCLNMALSFGKLQVTRPSSSRERRRFLTLSSIAWGLPAIMTSLCAYAFEKDHHLRKWYSPSLSETRTCYNEVSTTQVGAAIGVMVIEDLNKKYGTAFFFYLPEITLIIVNVVCIALTLKRIQFLQRGNSVLYREEGKVSRGQYPMERENSQDTTSRNRQVARSSLPDAKKIRLYVQLLLMTGLVEMFIEAIVWTTTLYPIGEHYSMADHELSYRATGYVADFFRAVCVAWLAAPDGGYLGALRGRWGDKERERGAKRGGARAKKSRWKCI